MENNFLMDGKQISELEIFSSLLPCISLSLLPSILSFHAHFFFSRTFLIRKQTKETYFPIAFPWKCFSVETNGALVPHWQSYVNSKVVLLLTCWWFSIFHIYLSRSFSSTRLGCFSAIVAWRRILVDHYAKHGRWCTMMY